MIESLLVYAISFYFFFYLFNHSWIGEGTKNWVIDKVPALVAYSIQCAFCLTFWFTLVLVCWEVKPPYFLITAPVVNLFLELSYRKLTVNRDGESS